MRCCACNRNLSDYESTRRHALTGAYLDICRTCMKSIGEMVAIPTFDRPELLLQGDMDEEPDSSSQHIEDTDEQGLDEVQ